MDTAQTRQQLKAEIVAYLKANNVNDKDLLIKACNAIKDSAFNSEALDAEMLRDAKTRQYAKEIGIKQGDEFYYRLSWYFAPRHYATLVGFVTRYEELVEAEMKTEMELERAIENEVDSYRDPLADENYDELGTPDFAVCVYENRIEVRAYTKGVGGILPKKGRKYIGNMYDVRWQFPLSALVELERLGRPVVKISELCPAK